MARFADLLRRVSLLFLSVSFLHFSSVFAQRNPTAPTIPSSGQPNMGTTREQQMLSVSGNVSDASTHSRLEGARVDLRATTGGSVGSTFTRGNGEFEFDNIPQGVYTLVVEEDGYESTSQQVQVMYGPVFGLFVELRRNSDAAGIPRGSTKVSVRELTIPHKAHDAMQKGMELLYGKSDYVGSIKQFQKAIQIYPDYYEAYAQIGVAYMKQKDEANSEQSLRKSIDLSKQQYVDAYFLLAELFSNGGHFAQAEPLARKAVDLDPNSWQGQSELSRALLGLNRPADAEASATAAVKLQPDNPTLHLMLANVHMERQNYPALLNDLNAYLKLAPKGPYADQARKQRDEVQAMLAHAQAAPGVPASSKP